MKRCLSSVGCRAIVLLGMCTVLCDQLPSAAAAEPARRTPALLHPKRDEIVEREYQVEGKAATVGQTIVLIRALGDEEAEWWIQPPVEVNSKGMFTVDVRFGNKEAKPGDKFQVVAVSARTEEELELFRDQESIAELPEDLPQSKAIEVTLLDSEDAEEPANDVLENMVVRPAGNGKVSTLTQIAGKFTARGWPVVMIRSEDVNDDWWVQGPVNVASDRTFSVMGHFGNERTPSGKRFLIVVIAVKNEEEAQQYMPGMTFAELPKDLPHTEPVVVTLRRTDVAGHTK